jgi:hypothetical protein
MNWLPPSIEWNPTTKLFGRFRLKSEHRAGKGCDSYSWITLLGECWAVSNRPPTATDNNEYLPPEQRARHILIG